MGDMCKITIRRKLFRESHDIGSTIGSWLWSSFERIRRVILNNNFIFHFIFVEQNIFFLQVYIYFCFFLLKTLGLFCFSSNTFFRLLLLSVIHVFFLNFAQLFYHVSCNLYRFMVNGFSAFLHV